MPLFRLPRQPYRPVLVLSALAMGLWSYSARPLQDIGNRASISPPDENRFTKVVLAEKLNEPLEMVILPDERVLLVERHGAVRIY